MQLSMSVREVSESLFINLLIVRSENSLMNFFSVSEFKLQFFIIVKIESIIN